MAHGVVLQKGRGRPQADELRRPDVAATSCRQWIVVLGAGHRMGEREALRVQEGFGDLVSRSAELSDAELQAEFRALMAGGK